MDLRISIGSSTGAKVGVCVFAVFFLAILSGVAYVVRMVAAGTVLLPVFAAVLALIALGFLRMLLGTFLARADLSGTTLSFRPALLTRRADLSADRVWVRWITVARPGSRRGQRVPQLCAGRVKLPLMRFDQGPLPSAELMALAGAMEANPDPEAARTGLYLRGLATGTASPYR